MIQLFGKAVVEKATESIVEGYIGRSDMDNMQSLKRNWRELSCKASDIEEEVNREEMSGKKRRKSEVDNWLKDIKKLSPEIDALETGGSCWRLPLREDPVGKLQLQVKALIDQSRHFNGLVLDAYDNIREPCSPTKLFGVKFKEVLERIWPCLVTDDISSIGIYGMGGVGKTTLVKHIKYHLSINTNYLVLWVTVSQEFSIRSLQDKIANVLRIPLSSKDEEEVRADILRGAFRKKTRLIVLILDDVWEEFCLDKVGIPLDARNCRLILTTRSLDVCNRLQCQRKFGLKTLDTNEAWDLFKYKLGREPLLHEELEDIAKSIVKECAGLPLAIITVAGSMRGVSDICEWRNALKQLEACSRGHKEMEQDVFPILEWSFNRLDEYERKCFLYCSLHPEDCDINRKELIDLFIWAELMPERNSRSEEFDQGDTILNKLIRVCLLEASTNFLNKKCVKLHDLVRDMALRITSGNSKLEMSSNVPRFLVKSIGEENHTLKQKEWTEDLHAVSFQTFVFYLSQIEVPLDWSPKCPKLSTLILPKIHIERIPDSFFRHMCGLKVLNLNGCTGITELPNSVSDLVNLTALILGNCYNLRSVPPLGKLMQLRELDLSNTKIQDFPQGWESLVNLEMLNLRYCGSFIGEILPEGTFSKLHRLKWLILPLCGTVQVNDPEVLNQLESFKGCLCFTNFHKISRWPECDYDLYVNDDSSKYDGPLDFDDDDDIPERRLYFHQCSLGRGSNNPTTLLLLPSDVQELIFKDCSGRGIRCLSDAFKNFTSLNDLFALEIDGLDGIEFLWQFSSPAPRDQQVDSSFSPLRNLYELILNNLPDLVGLFFGESEACLLPPGTFSSLYQLEICECRKLKQLFTVQQLQNLVNLGDLFVHDCEGLEEIAADDNGIGQRGGEGIQLTSCEATATVILPKLRWLTLSGLPQLNICKAAMRCDSIEEIEILDCAKVKRLPLSLPTVNGLPSPPSTLRTITGNKEWWESLGWEDHCTKNALDPFFTPQ